MVKISTKYKIDNPTAHPRADKHYWLVRTNDQDYLFTDEALKEAADRAVKSKELLPQRVKTWWQFFGF